VPYFDIICTCWIGTGGSKPTPQAEIFSHQCGGHLQPVGVKPPKPPTNRTLGCCHPHRPSPFYYYWA